MLGKVQLLELMEALVHQKKKVSINFSKANTKFCLNLHYNVDNSYLFVNGKEIFKFKANNKNVNFPTQFQFVTRLPQRLAEIALLIKILTLPNSFSKRPTECRRSYPRASCK